MKCAFCGNENLVKTYFPIESYGEGGAVISNDVDVFLCLDCGHFEFFSKIMANRYYETLAWISDTEKEIENLHYQLAELQNPMVSQRIKDKIEKVNSQLKSIDITIRQQQTLRLKRSKLEVELRNIPTDIRSLEEKISHLEWDLRLKKDSFERKYKMV